MDILNAQSLPESALEWDEAQWLDHFESQGSENGRATCYIFDFMSPPSVRGDSSGYLDSGGKLVIMFDVPCPACGRPTIAMVRRWHEESAAERAGLVTARMKEIDYHQLHSRPKS